MRDDPFDTLITALRELEQKDQARRNFIFWEGHTPSKVLERADLEYRQAHAQAKDAFTKAVLEAVFNR